jgi:hypothetical protein
VPSWETEEARASARRRVRWIAAAAAAIAALLTISLLLLLFTTEEISLGSARLAEPAFAVDDSAPRSEAVPPQREGPRGEPVR